MQSHSFFTRARRRLSLVAVAVMATALIPAFAGTAHAANSTFFTINSRSPLSLSGNSYKLTISASKSSGGSFLNVALARTAPTGNHPTQRHAYSFSLSSGAIQIDGSDLLPTSINTGTQMGAFGKVDMDLKNPGSLSTRKIKCPNGTVVGSISTRNGTWSGNFTLNAHDSFFGTIHKTAIPVTVTKFFSNGKTCGGGGGGSCFTGFFFSASQTSKPLSLSANRPLGSTGRASITLSYGEFVSPASISHSISGSVSLSAFHISSTAAVTIAAGSLAPFASGTIHFTKKSSSTNGTKCKTTTSQEQYASGSVTAKFDSRGQKTMNGADFASLNKTFKA
jgi:hypothetical protein